MSLFRRFKRLLAGKSNMDKMLTKVLCRIGPYKDTFTMGEATHGIIGFGEIGSGKSTLLNAIFLEAFLRAGMGGMIPVVKAGEGREIARIVKACGRGNDLVVFNENTTLSFSLLEYVLGRGGDSSREIVNLSNLIMRIHRITKAYRENNSTGSQDHYWEDSLESLIMYMIQLLLLAQEPVNVLAMQPIVLDLFNEEDAKKYSDIWSQIRSVHVSDERKEEIYADYLSWAERNAFLRVFLKASERTDMSSEELESMEQVGDFFIKVLPNISEKTYSIITQTFLTLIQPFQTGILRRHFTEGVSEELKPENCFLENKIILVDFPVKTWGITGLYAIAICKTAYQQAVEKRVIENETDPKPCFLWIDEAHHLLSSHDANFQLTSRSKLSANVYITQTLPSLRAAFEGHTAQERVKSLVSSMGLKIFLANSCRDTNVMASELIGKHYVDTVAAQVGGERTGHHTYSQSHRDIVPPEAFTQLETGGPPKYRIEAVFFKAGKKWRSGANYLRTKFRQKFYR